MRCRRQSGNRHDPAAKMNMDVGKLVRKVFGADWPELFQGVQKIYSYGKMTFITAFLDLSDMYNS
jgi:hypothetical protein